MFCLIYSQKVDGVGFYAPTTSGVKFNFFESMDEVKNFLNKNISEVTAKDKTWFEPQLNYTENTVYFKPLALFEVKHKFKFDEKKEDVSKIIVSSRFYGWNIMEND